MPHGSANFFDLRRFAGASAQIVQFRPAHFTLADHGDVRDLGRMHREGTLYPYAVREPAHGKRLADTAVFLCDHNAFKGLEPLARALDDFYADLYGVAYVESGNAVSIASINPFIDFTSIVRSVRGRIAPEDRPKSFAILS